MWYKILLFLVPFASSWIARGILPARFVQCALHSVDGWASETTRPYRSYIILQAPFQTLDNEDENVNTLRRPCQTPSLYFEPGNMYACMYVCIAFWWRDLRKTPLGRPTRTWKDSMNTDLQDVGWEGMEWIDLAQDGDMR
jgi:hypothetical protein